MQKALFRKSGESIEQVNLKTFKLICALNHRSVTIKKQIVYRRIYLSYEN